ncbi:MAG: CpaF family protein [Acidimicrobiia bacterium]
MIDRVSRAIALGSVSLTPDGVQGEARRLLEAESPWRVEDNLAGVLGHIVGLGPAQRLIDEPDVTDVLVNGPDQVWVDRGAGLERVDVRFGSDEELVAAVERVIAPLGLRIDRSSPMVEARLPDGSRLHAVLPPAAVDHPLVAVRRFTQAVGSLEDLAGSGWADPVHIERLRRAVKDRETIVISGGTGSGKTTLLNLLGGLIPPGERVVTIEDAAELALPGHVVRLEARPPNAEGAGEITMRSLLRSALRLRPDRIILGEVRGPEALDLISAMNTGHRGSMTTVHANSPREAMWRLETLALSAGDTSELTVRRQLWEAVDLVVQVERHGRRRRLVSLEEAGEIAEELR